MRTEVVPASLGKSAGAYWVEGDVLYVVIDESVTPTHRDDIITRARHYAHECAHPDHE